MLKVLSTLFDSNETYLSKHVAGINRAQAFPTRNLVNSDEFIRNTINDSIIVSGGSDENIYSGFSKTQLLSILTADNSDNDLAFFYSYAFDVCEVLNKPTTVQGMYSIDWLGIGWQQELLTSPFNRDRALDLLNRYDRNMAEKAVKGVCRLERLSRGNMIGESSVADGFNDGKVIIKEVYGSNSAMSKQCLEIIQCEAE